MYVCVCVCIHVYKYVCMHACMDVWMCESMYACMFACVHVCVDACVRVRGLFPPSPTTTPAHFRSSVVYSLSFVAPPQPFVVPCPLSDPVQRFVAKHGMGEHVIPKLQALIDARMLDHQQRTGGGRQ
jgi:hypothetical protein